MGVANDGGELLAAPDTATEALRLPPHSIDAEQAVLGGLMLDNTAWDRVADHVIEEDFYRRDHRLIFRAIAELADRKQPVRRRNALGMAGAAQAAGRRGRSGYTGRPGAGHAERGKHPGLCRYRPRAFRAAAVDIGGQRDRRQRLCHRRPQFGELLEHAEQRVFQIAERGKRGQRGFRSIRSLLGRGC